MLGRLGVLVLAGMTRVVDDILADPDSIEGDGSRSEAIVVRLPSASSAWLTCTEHSALEFSSWPASFIRSRCGFLATTTVLHTASSR